MFVNGCLRVLRSGTHWRDLAERYGIVTAGQMGDVTQIPALLKEQTGQAALADKAYDSNVLRATIAQIGAEAVIPSNRTRKDASTALSISAALPLATDAAQPFQRLPFPRRSHDLAMLNVDRPWRPFWRGCFARACPGGQPEIANAARRHLHKKDCAFKGSAVIFVGVLIVPGWPGRSLSRRITSPTRSALAGSAPPGLESI
ncbi:MAG: hypothetical protein ACOY45_04270 [Pseudomonadota bacterium]